MTGALEVVVVTVFAYFVVYNLFTLSLLAMSYGEMSWLVRGRQVGRAVVSRVEAVSGRSPSAPASASWSPRSMRRRSWSRPWRRSSGRSTRRSK